MSRQPTGLPRDWRRQRRPAVTPEPRDSGGPSGPPDEPSLEPGEGVVLSRTLFSYLEPALDAVASYGLPLVIAGVVALVAGSTLVAFVGSMRLYGYINIGIGSGLIVLVGLISLSSVTSAFISRTGRYGVNSLVMTGAFTGIVVVVGVIAFENSRRLDVTATNQFSLANRTLQILKELEGPVRATAFYKDEGPAGDPARVVRRNRVEETLKEFAARTGKFSYRIVDPDLKPDIANKYFGAKPATFVAESVVVESLTTNLFDAVEPRDQAYGQLEQDLVTSILVATGKERKTVYFLLGHGERSPDTSGSDGYSKLRSGLEQDNHRVEVLRWEDEQAEVDVPDDAALLVIARPTTALPKVHAEALDRYLQGRDREGSKRREGGRLIVLVETDTNQPFREFLARWGVLAATGYIRDVGRSVPGNPHILRLSAYNRQAPPEIIFPRGEPLQVSFMSGATALGLVNDRLRVPIVLAATSPDSYLISDPERTDPKTDAGEQSDPKGPFSPAVLVRGIGPVGTAPPADSDFSWLAVFGDSDFLSNSLFDRGSGADLFLNSANYLLGDYSLVSIRDKAFTFREFNLNRNEYNFVRFSSWLFLPGLLALMAALVWWVRR